VPYLSDNTTHGIQPERRWTIEMCAGRKVKGQCRAGTLESYGSLAICVHQLWVKGHEQFCKFVSGDYAESI
jgi:hypothetical protein